MWETDPASTAGDGIAGIYRRAGPFPKVAEEIVNSPRVGRVAADDCEGCLSVIYAAVGVVIKVIARVEK